MITNETVELQTAANILKVLGIKQDWRWSKLFQRMNVAYVSLWTCST